jgi:hypothetical protein
MRAKIASLAVLATLFVSGTVFAVPDEYDDSQSHPLRVTAYLIHPVGVGLEWLIFRPFHWIVSRNGADMVFGHTPHGCNEFSGVTDRCAEPPPSQQYAAPATVTESSREAARAEDAAERAERSAEKASRAAEKGMMK